MTPLLVGLVWAGLLALALVGLTTIGRRLLQLAVPVGAAAFPWPYATGLGLAVLSTVGQLLIGAGAFRSPIPHLLAAGVAGLGAGELVRRWPELRPALRPPWPVAVWATLGLTLVALPLLVLPPMSQDDLVYHLEVPRQAWLAGGWPDLPFNMYSYLPMAIEVLYLFPAGLDPASGFPVAMTHYAFLLLTLLAAVHFVGADHRKHPSGGLAWLTLLAFATVPTLWLVAASAYIDAAWMFYALLLARSVGDLLRPDRPAAGVPAALLVGFYLVIKYPGYHFLVVLGAAAALLARATGDRVRVDRRVVALAALGLAVFAGPHFLRLLIQTGNPVHPFLTGLFGSPHEWWSPVHEAALWGFVGSYGGSLGASWLAPLEFLVAGVNPVLGDPVLHDGVIGPLLLIWLWPALTDGAFRRRQAWPLLMLALYLPVWGIWLRQARFLLPALPLVLMVLLDWTRHAAPRQRQVATGLIVLTLGFNLAVLGPRLARQPGWGYLVGTQTRAEALTDGVPAYAAQRWCNEHLPPNSRIWLLMTGNRNFYLERPYLGDSVVEDFTFNRWLRETEGPADMADRFRARGVTHFLVRPAGILHPALYADAPELAERARRFFAGQTRLLHRAGEFVVLEMPPADRNRRPERW